MFDVKTFRAQFPIFQHAENASLVYFDNAATTQKPACVIEAISDYYRRYNANAHRSSHRLGRLCTELIEQTRKDLSRFVGAASAQNIVFSRGATDAINTIAHGLASQINAGDEILLTRAEHHANLVPWQRLAQRSGATLVFLPSVNGQPDFNCLEQFITPKTRLFCCTAASNVLGVVAPFEQIKNVLQSHHVLWLLDAAQLLAHGPVNVEQMGCDFLVGSAHKFYGPTGIGFFYARTSALELLQPSQFGGQMVSAVSLESSEFQSGPLKFEAGTPPIAEIAGLQACLDFWQQQDVAALNTYEQELLHCLMTALKKISQVTVLSNAKNNIGIVSFTVSGLQSQELAIWLDEQDIAVRAGYHCATPLLTDAGIEDCLRVSLCAYNTVAEVDRLIECLIHAIEELSGEVNVIDQNDKSPNLLNSSTHLLNSNPHYWQELTPIDLSDCQLEDLYQKRDWQKRYKLLLQWSKVLPSQPTIRTQQHKVEGCEADTWLLCLERNGVCCLFIDSTANVVKGLAIVLLLHLQNKPKQTILNWHIEAVFERLQLSRYLSESRVNGFNALWQQIKRDIDKL